LAKTGKPNDPSIKYNITVVAASLYPKIIPRNKTTNVCIVAGTKVKGVCILDEIASNPVPNITVRNDFIILELSKVFIDCIYNDTILKYVYLVFY
jgi:hypothetical protein